MSDIESETTAGRQAGAGKAPGDTPRRKGPSLLVLLPLILFGGLCVLFYLQLSHGGSSRVIPSVLLDKPAPEFDLPALKGLTYNGQPAPGLSRADLNGKVTLINFWASWCVPCRQEHPMLLELAKDDRIQLTGINVRDSEANALGYMEEHGNPFARNGVDQNYRTAIDFGVTGQPETFLIDTFGCIRYKHVGPLYEELWAEKFEPLIKESLSATAPPEGCQAGASG
ncbi:DsbE family thiol:disulfide interchange protein [Rhodobium gokarnense]|uniref:Cytochrome c biogenesis protein CcmG/thiol:disulfide interchange protein DsbE n=1 Tax=Rhodobium gokarnense TaxID=364296 RepID=A0ABT3H8N4_9HYPH|nr:DsbE family thiol:disulfide interchange protein [Rhodobium gokarnense]MCW2306746.1 cytochrome c biogenesis protein CcmG/thiol:disulfide interchange protein DsbE [Rhodobium gokarnense]